MGVDSGDRAGKFSSRGPGSHKFFAKSLAAPFKLENGQTDEVRQFESTKSRKHTKPGLVGVQYLIL